MLHGVRQCKEPEYLYNILSRDNKQGNIVMENTRLVLYRDSFIFRGTVMWNTLPKTLKMEKKMGTFKKGLRKWIFEAIKGLLG